MRKLCQHFEPYQIHTLHINFTTLGVSFCYFLFVSAFHLMCAILIDEVILDTMRVTLQKASQASKAQPELSKLE